MTRITQAVSVALALACSVSAAPVTWYLRGATFTDGGLLVGSFTYDADTGVYSNARIFSTPGNDVHSASNDPNVVRAGKGYSLAGAAGFFDLSNKHAAFQEAGPPIKTVTGFLDIRFNTALSNSGGVVDLDLSSGEDLYADNGGAIVGPTRVLRAGKVVAISGTGPQTWYLSGVTMDDGAQAIGSFVYDAASNTYSQVQVQTTKGGTFPAANFISMFNPPAFSPAVVSATNFAALTTTTPTAGGRVLNFALSTPLTNKPGTSANSITDTKTAEGTCSSATCSNNGNVTFGGVVRNMVSGIVTTTPPAGYIKAIPHFVDGGAPAWQSVMVFSNLSDAPAAFTARFFDDNGAPLTVPGIGSVTTGLVPARGVIFLRSSGTSPGSGIQGWTRVDNAQNLSVSNQLVLKSANAGGDQQGAMYGDTAGANAVSVPYDNTNGAINGFAVVNPDPAHGVTILAVGYDVNGNIVATDSTITLKPLGHRAFIFSAVPGYSALAKGQGNIRIYAVPDGAATGALNGINCLLLKFQPSLAFANIAVTNQ